MEYHEQRLFSPLLYQLSYLAYKGTCARRRLHRGWRFQSRTWRSAVAPDKGMKRIAGGVREISLDPVIIVPPLVHYGRVENRHNSGNHELPAGRSHEASYHTPVYRGFGRAVRSL